MVHWQVKCSLCGRTDHRPWTMILETKMDNTGLENRYTFGPDMPITQQKGVETVEWWTLLTKEY